MQQCDYTSSNPYYHYPQNPNLGHNSAPIPNPTPSPSSYASAPPFTATCTPSSDYSSYPPPYPDLLSAAPAPPLQSYNPPPPPPAPALQQPQPSSPFPSFESHAHSQPQQPYYLSANSPYPSNYPTQYDQSGPYFEESGDKYVNYGSGRGGEFGQDIYGDGVFAYKGSKLEPYGARGTAPKSSTWSSFDDFGRPIGFNSSPKGKLSAPAVKIVKAVPKVDTQQDVKSGVQRFRVKLLAESGGQSTQDVLCQIGLDGIRMLDPSTSRTLRIYPLDTITRCDVTDSSTFALWSKSAVDIEPRRIRLQSNSYTTSTLLDTVTAATVQFKEIGGRIRPSESPKVSEQPTEKKKGLVDWINIVKPVNEEKDHWVPDEAVSKCTACGSAFNAFVRKHHCRNCGDIFCDKCTQGRTALTADENTPAVRVCDRCMAEVSRRLSSAKEAANRSTGLCKVMKTLPRSFRRRWRETAENHPAQGQIVLGG